MTQEVNEGSDRTFRLPGGQDALIEQVGDSKASIPRPPKELKGFAKVNLRPGETKQVALMLDRRAFSFFDVKKHDWHAEPGDFAILVGSSSADIRLNGAFTLAAE